MDERFLKADSLGIRLERIGELPLWEPTPVWKHQKAIDRIRDSIKTKAKSSAKSGCACVHASDVYISFPDGSLKRPDIAIFCREPEEQESAITLIPEAVIEVVSKGFEAKDLEIAPRFYLSQGIKDIVIFDPATLFVMHVRKDGTRHHTSPVKIALECGCECTV